MSHSSVRVGNQSEPPQPKVTEETTGKMNGMCFKKLSACSLKMPQPNSKMMIAALVVLLVVGLAAAGVGVTGFLAQHHMLPAALAKLNALGAIGPGGAYAMMAGGGVLILLAIGFLIAAVKKKCANKKRSEIEPPKQNPLSSKRTSESTYSSMKIEFRLSTDEINRAPEHLRSVYGKLKAGEGAIVAREDNENVDIIVRPQQLKDMLADVDPIVRLNVPKETRNHEDFNGYTFVTILDTPPKK